jgi:hypothetical protein
MTTGSPAQGWLRSPFVRLALLPLLAGVIVARAIDSVGVGLLALVAAVGLAIAAGRLGAHLRRRREWREHIAGLGRY